MASDGPTRKARVVGTEKEMDNEGKLMTGVVRKFDDTKGYGFIRVEGITEDIFVHHQSIKMDGFRTLAIGDTVQFRISRGERGWKAGDVVKVSSSQSQPAKS
jgi:Cold shock proteins